MAINTMTFVFRMYIVYTCYTARRGAWSSLSLLPWVQGDSIAEKKRKRIPKLGRKQKRREELLTHQKDPEIRLKEIIYSHILY